jgi:hypothetical protein
MNQKPGSDSSVLPDGGGTACILLRVNERKPFSMPKTRRIEDALHNPANFAYWIGEEPWVSEKLIYEIPDSVTTKYQDDVR